MKTVVTARTWLDPATPLWEIGAGVLVLGAALALATWVTWRATREMDVNSGRPRDASSSPHRMIPSLAVALSITLVALGASVLFAGLFQG